MLSSAALPVMASMRRTPAATLLTKGAGIPRDSLQGRIVWESEKDQRYYLMQEIERLGTINPKAHNNLTLCEVELLTGRTHQIRAHMSSIGCPILGDNKYGNKKLV